MTQFVVTLARYCLSEEPGFRRLEVDIAIFFAIAAAVHLLDLYTPCAGALFPIVVVVLGLVCPCDFNHSIGQSLGAAIFRREPGSPSEMKAPRTHFCT